MIEEKNDEAKNDNKRENGVIKTRQIFESLNEQEARAETKKYPNKEEIQK